MNNDRHCVAGFFCEPEQALSAQSDLIELGVLRGQSQIFQRDSGAWVPEAEKRQQAGSTSALKDMLVDGAIGGAVGAGLGALTEVALVAANVSLFVASPLLAPLVLLGWGATVGGTIGALVGAGNKEAPLSALIRDAVSNGQVVLLVETRSAQERDMVRESMKAAVGEIKDLVTKPA
jgi:hypothetical protein